MNVADTGCGGACYTDTQRGDYDGFGHYRKSITTSNVPNTPARTTYTNHQPDETRWLLGKYSDSWTQQGSGSAAMSTKTITTFDATLGIPTSVRRLRIVASDPSTIAISSSDLLTAWCRDSRGFVTSERYFGGDTGSIPSSNFCSISWSEGNYFLNHTYTTDSSNPAKIVKHTAWYSGPSGFVSPLVADEDLDWRTDLAWRTSDTAGVSTEYRFDSIGRITALRPTGRSWAEYEYSPSSDPPSIISRQCPTGSTGCTATALLESRYYYDDLGRLNQQTQKTGATTWAATWLDYDQASRKRYSSVPVEMTSGSASAMPAGTVLTTWNYDVLGRVEKETRPDGSTTELVYTGDRIKTRKSWIRTSETQDSAVLVKEHYDGLGRLVAVVEPSGPTSAASPTGSEVNTKYQYDMADRLAVVMMYRDGAGPVQQRLFDYDGRGFLRWESHPESGMTGYTYDSRGHVKTKRQSAANTQFDLNYAYDGAERLVQIDERNPFATSPGEPAFRIVKKFEYGLDNEIGGSVPTDWRKGKLVLSFRYNYADVSPEIHGYRVDNTDIMVMYSDKYKDSAGRRTERVSEIYAATGARYEYPTLVRQIELAFAYNDLDLLEKSSYPTCVDCGAQAESGPWRWNMTYAYDQGRLASIDGFVNDISYWPNGMRKVLSHSNGIADTQIVGNMPRPSQISFGTYDRCVQPTLITQPASKQLSAGNTTTLSVTANGTEPFRYEWTKHEEGGLWEPAGTAQSITVGPLTTTTSYQVVVSNPCHTGIPSDVAVITAACPQPVIDGLAMIPQPDGSWILAPTGISARSSAQYQWRKLPSSTIIGSQRELAVAAVSEATTWSLTVVDGSCGSATANVTLHVPLQITSTGLVATAYTSPSRVVISWPAVSGATSYEVQRRSGTEWETIGTTATSSYTDAAIQSSRTYAYRVKLGKNYSNSDTATTMSFVPVMSGQSVTAANVNSSLAAVNSVRAAAGWPALSWAEVLTASDPLPNPAQRIVARHVISCRARMNEALQALGVLLQQYTRPDLMGQPIWPVDFNEIQDRAK